MTTQTEKRSLIRVPNEEREAAADRRAAVRASIYTPIKDTVGRNVPPTKAPPSTWGVGIWSLRPNKDTPPSEYPCFKDHEGQWWWATTSGQNGINPTVEKTTPPIGWRPFR